MHAAIVERGRDTALDGAAHRLGDDDPARLGQRLKACGDVDAVAVEVAVRFLGDVAKMDADAEAHAALIRDVARRRIERALHRERGSDGTGRGIEYREHRVAGHVDHMTVIGLDLGLEDVASGIQRCHRR